MQQDRPPGQGEEHFGLDAWRGSPHVMRETHWHDEIELNFVERGTVAYLAGGQLIMLEAGHLAVFWGAVPHRVVEAEAGTLFTWLTLPLAAVLRWSLPEAFARPLLHGHFLSSGPGTALDTDAATFRRWVGDLQGPLPEGRAALLLEAEARLRRLSAGGTGQRPLGPVNDAALRHAQGMAGFIAQHYAQPLTAAEIADAVNLSPHHAMSVFRGVMGRTLVSYLTQYRVAHAQRLLATTDVPILDVASECGFSSVSRFYEAFGASCGRSPRAYRVAMRAGPS